VKREEGKGERVEERRLIIKNKLGLHARAANLIVRVANRYDADITVEKDGIEANGKSIMGLLMLAAGKGSEIVVRAKGQDAKEAVEELSELIEGKFGEE